MQAQRRMTSFYLCLFLITGIWSSLVLGADKNIDLDGRTTNGNESVTSLTVVTTFPVKIKNKVTNKAIGDAFTFQWLSAGPGGFKSSLPAGTSTGVGAAWTWETTQNVYSFTGNACTNDICFTKTAGPDPVTSRGPFAAPGRSLTTSGVTVTSASLTTSLITFFSPPTVLATVSSSVQPLGGGGFAYQSRIENKTASSIDIGIDAYPPGCCPDVHQKNCSGTCVYYLHDPKNCGSCGNICDIGDLCSDGECVPDCPDNQKACNGVCIDVSSDPLNCGGCGIACGSNQICQNAACTTCSPPLQTACDNHCVNIHTDSENCGGCGINCNFLCPSTGHGTCSNGQSCLCVQGFAPIVPDPDEAPVCETPSQELTIPPGGVVQTCQLKTVLAKEVPSRFTVCGANIPDGPTTCTNGDFATEGTFNILQPDLTKTAGDVFPTPVRMEMTDPSGDGMAEPGETIGLKVSLLNAGSKTLTGVTAVLTSPPVDLSDDGIANPVSVTITNGTSSYPDLAGAAPNAADCASVPASPAAVANAISFSVAIPSTHPGDVGRPFNLKITGTVQGTGAPFQMDVPLVVGIAGACNASLLDNTFDGVDGLASPMARLVKLGGTVIYPQPSQQGKTRPLKLRILCGSTNLSGTQFLPPEIVGLSRGGVPLDITVLNLNDDAPNRLNPFFRWNSGSNWIFNLNTKLLAKGTYVITIRLGGEQDYVTGMILN